MSSGGESFFWLGSIQAGGTTIEKSSFCFELTSESYVIILLMHCLQM
jgi:hypothetical protein